MKAILSPNPYRDRGLRTAQAAGRILRACGVEAVTCLPFPLESGSRPDLPARVELRILEQELPTADVLICFGGDGTILHMAKSAHKWDVPVLGVNLGSVGFIAELEAGELSLLSRLAGGRFGTEERMMLDVAVLRDGRTLYRDTALNDAVVTKGAVARVLELEVTADRVVMASFSGDGVVVSTPTGSTAYSMAAGGPIVEPTAQNIIVTPICAHSLRAKSVVLDQARTVGVRTARGARKTAYLSVDGGKAFKLLPSDLVEIKRSEAVVRLVRLTGRSFYEGINRKLGM